MINSRNLIYTNILDLTVQSRGFTSEKKPFLPAFSDLFYGWRIVKLSATVCQKILYMGFHSLTLCEDVDLTAFGSVQRPVLYNYQYLFTWENIPGLIHLYSHLFHAVQANMDRANRQ